MICALQHGDLNAQLFTSTELALLNFAEKLHAKPLNYKTQFNATLAEPQPIEIT
jgi:hypothetical protein